ncbi:MAG TPA: aldo/keto reductase [Tepidiformaceae bacterium]|nr:aldo/keto reductase [Tepidiformaceae bacterium]
MFRSLGQSGLQVSLVGLGCNNFGMRCDEAQTADIIHAAIDHGITLFDTADVYGGRGKSEELMGKALKGRRSQVILATKFAAPMGEGPHTSGGSRKYIMSAVEDSLRRLETDYIDLYQMHRPDPATPIEETIRALDDLITAGKVRYIGNSNFSGWQIADADWVAKELGANRFVSAQNEWSMVKRSVEREIIPACERFGLGMLPFFPLASGLLTGKYRRGEAPAEGTRLQSWGARAQGILSDQNFDVVEKLDTYATERGHTILELAFSWLAAFPVVSSVIAGATSTEQVAQNARAADWVLTAAEKSEVDAILAGTAA